jgi:peptidoglycan/LPS O-acetylase OafA/YrhL
MPRSLSTYLDLLRVAAALAVFGSHATFPEFTGGMVAPQIQIGRAAVIVFFVLSGYVITYAAAERERSLGRFAVSRLARVYSVAAGALALTAAVDLLTLATGFPRGIPTYQYVGWWKYLPLFLSFSSEAWTFRESVFSNAVFWSLSYEVWYYIAFAAAIYYRGWRRILLLAAILAFMRERMLVEFPLWILGSLIYRLHGRLTLNRNVAAVLLAGSLAGLVAVRASGLDDRLNAAANALLGGYPAAHLHASQFFASDYVVGLLAGLNIFAARYCGFALLEVPPLRRAIVYAASFTFTLYLTHRPFLNLMLLLGHDPQSPARIVLMVVAVLAAVWLFGLVTERRKLAWRRWFGQLVTTARDRLARSAPLLYRLATPTLGP